MGFTYPRATQAGLADISLKITAGETNGIAGSTGAGKTTLADVILDLLMPDQGAILVDAIPLTNQTLPRWRKAVGYVPQDIFLTDASIAENIAFGLEPDEIDRARLQSAAQIANLHDLITTELAEGYEILPRGMWRTYAASKTRAPTGWVAIALAVFWCLKWRASWWLRALCAAVAWPASIKAAARYCIRRAVSSRSAISASRLATD